MHRNTEQVDALKHVFTEIGMSTPLCDTQIQAHQFEKLYLSFGSFKWSEFSLFLFIMFRCVLMLHIARAIFFVFCSFFVL